MTQPPRALATGEPTTAGGDAGGDQEPDGLLKIGVVAARLGISERTLRYYEEVGLLRPHQHHPGAGRRYCDADVERVQRIRELQGLMGFNLEEIRRIVAAEDRLRSLREPEALTVVRTVRTRLLAVPGRIVNRSGTLTLRAPARWPWADLFHRRPATIRALPAPT